MVYVYSTPTRAFPANKKSPYSQTDLAGKTKGNDYKTRRIRDMCTPTEHFGLSQIDLKQKNILASNVSLLLVAKDAQNDTVRCSSTTAVVNQQQQQHRAGMSASTYTASITEQLIDDINLA